MAGDHWRLLSIPADSSGYWTGPFSAAGMGKAMTSMPSSRKASRSSGVA
jgi:hypothetical protein